MKADRHVVSVSYDAGGGRAVIPEAKGIQCRGMHVLSLVARPAAYICPEERGWVPFTKVRDATSLS